MTYVKNIQGLGVKGADSYYDDDLTTPNVGVFDGSTWYQIGDGGNIYNPLSINNERTYITLYNSITGGGTLYPIYSTEEASSDGEYVSVFTGIPAVLLSMKDEFNNNINTRPEMTPQLNKWNACLFGYDGLNLPSSQTALINGNSAIGTSNYTEITGSTNTLGKGYIGTRRAGTTAQNFVGNIAILSIYEGLFTAIQKAEFSSNPFGFMARLRAIPAEKAKLYLDIDFNKTGAALPTDEGEGNGGVGFPITLGAGTASYTPFA